MSDAVPLPSIDATRGRDSLRVAFALSLALHAAVLWQWVPRPPDRSLDATARASAQGPLQLRLEPPPESRSAANAVPPAASPMAAGRSPPASRAAPPRAAAQAVPRPPVIAREVPAPPVETAPAPQASAAPPTVLALGDFYTDLENRRRARLEALDPALASPAPSPLPPEDERARHNRIVAANLGLDRAPTFGREPVGGGIFQLQRIGSDYAEFVFFGWNKDIRRRSKQTFEVTRGDSPDIQVAVVRRVIGIIREHESGDFVWVSERLGRNITLSARPDATAGLEDFMLQEFFGDARRR